MNAQFSCQGFGFFSLFRKQASIPLVIAGDINYGVAIGSLRKPAHPFRRCVDIACGYNIEFRPWVREIPEALLDVKVA